MTEYPDIVWIDEAVRITPEAWSQPITLEFEFVDHTLMQLLMGEPCVYNHAWRDPLAPRTYWQCSVRPDPRGDLDSRVETFRYAARGWLDTYSTFHTIMLPTWVVERFGEDAITEFCKQNRYNWVEVKL